jgi:glycosyltransferase involved in cell wall biosynthesis
MTVSITTPTTHDRLHFNQRIRAVAKAQDYPNIVEHVFHYGKGTIGEKRNRCNEIAIGDIIVHMDSDDYYSHNWVSKVIEIMQANPQYDIYGLKDLYYTGGWKYTGSKNNNIVFGGTMAYRRTFWENHRFRNMQCGEDSFFCMGQKVLAHDFTDGFLATIHSGNTSPKNTANSMWTNLSRKDFPDSLLGIAEL